MAGVCKPQFVHQFALKHNIRLDIFPALYDCSSDAGYLDWMESAFLVLDCSIGRQATRVNHFAVMSMLKPSGSTLPSGFTGGDMELSAITSPV